MIQINVRTRNPFKQLNCDSDFEKILFEFLITENDDSNLVVKEPLSMKPWQTVPINAIATQVAMNILKIRIKFKLNLN